MVFKDLMNWIRQGVIAAFVAGVSYISPLTIDAGDKVDENKPAIVNTNSYWWSEALIQQQLARTGSIDRLVASMNPQTNFNRGVIRFNSLSLTNISIRPEYSLWQEKKGHDIDSAKGGLFNYDSYDKSLSFGGQQGATGFGIRFESKFKDHKDLIPFPFKF